MRYRKKAMTLEGKNITLRPLNAQDAETLLSICHEPGIARYNSYWAEGQTAADYEKLIAETPNAYAIELTSKNLLMGVVGYAEHPDLNETAIYFFLADAYKGCGYTKEAVTMLSDWCLSEGGFKVLVAIAPESHQSEGRLAEKCGFTLYEKRVTIGYRLSGLNEDVYYYYRKF